MGFRTAAEPASPLRWARLCEEASTQAYPPTETADVDGWVARASPLGFFRNASVWPRSYRSEGDVTRSLVAVEEFYRTHDLVPRIVVSPASQPVGLGRLLGHAGWDLRVQTHVLSASSVEVGQRTPPLGDPWAITLAEPGEVWDVALRLWAISDRRIADWPDVASVMVAAAASTRSVVVFHEDAPVATARVELSNPAIGAGVFGVWVDPAQRRRGIASGLMGALSRWAAAQGAARTWLQVETDNLPALDLYRRLGYRPIYRYDCYELAT